MKILRAGVVLLALLLLVAGGIVFWAYRDLQKPVSHRYGNEYVEISRGSTPDQTLARLESVGILSRAWPLSYYIKLTGKGTRLKAGEYRFPSPISSLTVLRKLEEGQQRLSRFTVIEGWTRWDVAAALTRLPELKLQSSDETLALMNDTTDIREIDSAAPNLEGYLYPDTYSFPPNTTAREIISIIVRRFRQEWKPDFVVKARALGKTPRQIVTIASLIETEAKLKEERPLVSSVIYNRLRLDIPLGIDSTVIYASKLAGKWKNDGKVYQSDLDRESPYNTRKARGLPPGPVASPGVRSIEAALDPAPTDYLYYVREPSRDDGAHNFYNNDRDFARGVQALRDWERARDSRAAGQSSEQSVTP